MTHINSHMMPQEASCLNPVALQWYRSAKVRCVPIDHGVGMNSFSELLYPGQWAKSFSALMVGKYNSSQGDYSSKHDWEGCYPFDMELKRELLDFLSPDYATLARICGAGLGYEPPHLLKHKRHVFVCTNSTLGT
eukprot:CAMPEP_0119398236 /NCGR_PEP_ID=MMETSP1334-20130426/140737_1 /TAXON_ID=127549 /ORGANISM="Calcidiscus leptoporus, Strain RCC1130" /LENGTH=134 /DNA_ID=CAMNT_0007422091 /DNA_START=1479 /DNA_END=1883 /DNA_ORIENTATION=+